MYFNWKKIKQSSLPHLIKFAPITYIVTVLGLVGATGMAYSLVVENPNTASGISTHQTSHNISAQNKIIVFVNRQCAENYLLSSLKKQGYFLINLVTSTSKMNHEEIGKAKTYYDSVIVQNETPEILKSLKLLLQNNKEYSLGEVYATQQSDIVLADIIRESFNKPFNGEAFRNLSRDKITAINHLNKTLEAQGENRVVTVDEFTKAISKQALPCSVKVMSSNQALETYFIDKSSDVAAIFEKLKAYKISDIKLWIQPYHKNLYRLQIVSFNNKAVPVALWHEKTYIKDGKVQDDIRTLLNAKESSVISEDKLLQLSHQLAKEIHLSHGIGEFVLAFHNKQVIVVDYNLTLPNPNRIEVMERVMGYSPLSYHLLQSASVAEIPLPKSEFKNIIAVNVLLNSKNDLLKLSMLPTFYRYYSAKGRIDEAPMIGELYLVHTDRSLAIASYAAIRNTEQLLLDPMFSSHSATHIVNFYREATKKKNNNFNLSQDHTAQTAETKETLKNLHHESQHIPKYVKPLNTKASIQDVMKYYIDIYDLYILHGKAPGTKVIPMNTGNPAFLPFSPIVTSLRKSLEENLIAYARYSMQVPTAEFIDKLTKYCQEEHLLSSNQKLQPNNVVIGHGSTNLYYLALKSIIKNKGDIVLVTRPTYGLFIDPIYTAGGELGFIDIEENDGWKVHPEKLHKTIHFYNEKAFNNYILTTFIKEYEKFLHALKVFNLEQESIPFMPHIEGITDLVVFDKYIESLNSFIDNISVPMVNKDELKFSFPPRVKAFYHMNPHNPTGAIYTKDDLTEIAKVIQDHPGIYVIDDLAHWGVLYEKVVPATFAPLEGMFEKTLTLMSLSKAYCVPGLRTGVAIGNTEMISEMQYRLLNSSSSASFPAMLALEAVYNAPKKERDDYLKSNSQEYLFRRNLMNVLIDGIQQTNLTLEQKIKIYQVILENEYKAGKPFDKKLLNLVLSGTPLVRTLTKPKGCWFHLLDVSKLIGAKIGDNDPFQTATDVRNAIYSICNIDTVPGEISGNFFNYSLRMSFSLSPQQIYNACKNINLFIGNYIIKYNPSILEKNYPSLESKKIDVLDESILNKALMRLYLNQAIQALVAEQTKISAVHTPQNKEKLQSLGEKITELNKLTEQILDPSFDKTIHNKIHNYLEKNENWVRSYLPDFEKLHNCVGSFKGHSEVS